MIELIIFYVLGVLISSSIILIWFESTIVVHISKFLRISKDDIYTFDEWSDDILIRFPFFGELFSCPICLSFWVCVGVAICIRFVNEFSWWFVVASVPSWPILVFLFFKTATKRD